MTKKQYFKTANAFWGRDNRRALWGYYDAVLSTPALKEQALFNIRSGMARRPESIGLSEDIKLIKGHRRVNKACYTVLCVAHTSGAEPFGGEKSFLDALDALGQVPLNVIVAMPGRKSAAYLEEVKARASHVVHFYYPWWKEAKPGSEAATARFESVINGFGVDYVYLNTIVLREAATAAARSGVHCTVHVRELPQFDEAMCRSIGAEPEHIIDKVLARADGLIFNSAETGRQFGGAQPGDVQARSMVIENTVSLDRFMSRPKPGRALKIGMLSSNIKKKGVEDFFELARRSFNAGDSFKYILIGPKNELVKDEYRKLKAVQGDRCNVRLLGYMLDSVKAIRQCDVVLNLSNFQESFGRTVIEAMAARRLVVAYAWGALSSVVEDGVTGFLAPFRDVEAVRARLKHIDANRGLFDSMTDAALAEVRRRFDFTVYAEKFRQYFDVSRQLLPTGASAAGRRAIDYTIVVPNYNYAPYLEERLLSLFRQTIKPRKIIFLDDCSTDNSVAVARALLSQSGIDYDIIVNEQNQGVYRQWERGVRLATTDYVWIAEADDRCAPEFIEHVVKENANLDIGIFYSQSRRIDSEGAVTSENNLHHTDAVSRTRWRESYSRAGDREVVDSLYYRNTLPNVSACVFKTKVIQEHIGAVVDFEYCGDWLLYATILKDHDIHYEAQALNDFRRHAASTTRKNISTEQYLDEVLAVKRYMEKHFLINKAQFEQSLLLLDKDYKLADGRRFQQTRLSLDYSQPARVSANKRVLFITTNDGSFTGGSEMLWREALLALYAGGVDVGVVIKKWEPAPPFYKDFNRRGVRIIYKGDDEEAEIRNFRPDLTVISTGDQDEGIAYFQLLKKHKLDYCIVTHLVKQPEYWRVKKRLSPDLIDGFSGSEKNFFTSRNNIHYMGVRLGVDIPRAQVFYNPTDVAFDIKADWPEHLSELNLAMPSRILKKHKGHDILVAIMQQPKWRARKLVINIYGTGPDEAWLKEQIAQHGISNIRLKGKANDLGAVWAENHGIFMPSYMEGLPIVLVGAMLARRVPVVTNVGGNAEVIDEGAGFVAPLPTVADVEKTLDEACRNFADFRAIGERARASVLRVIPEDPVADFNGHLLALLEGQPGELVEPAASGSSRLAVLGFHRSLTSVVAQWLHTAGLSMGEYLMPPAPSNPDGHYEDMPLVALHDDLLAEQGSSWLFAGEAELSKAAGQDTLKRYVALRDSLHGGYWGMKDPRQCLFLPNWQPVLGERGRYLVVLRHWSASIQSLLKRSARDLASGLGAPADEGRFWQVPGYAARMWLAYNERLLAFLESCPPGQRLVVTQQSLMQGLALPERVKARWQIPLDTTVPSPIKSSLVHDTVAESIRIHLTDEQLAQANGLWARLLRYADHRAEQEEPAWKADTWSFEDRCFSHNLLSASVFTEPRAEQVQPEQQEQQRRSVPHTKAQPKDAFDALSRRAQREYRALKLTAAEDHTRQALALNPDKPSEIVRLASILLVSGKAREAEALLASAIDRLGEVAILLLYQATVLDLLGRTEEAIALLAQAEGRPESLEHRRIAYLLKTDPEAGQKKLQAWSKKRYRSSAAWQKVTDVLKGVEAQPLRADLALRVARIWNSHE